MNDNFFCLPIEVDDLFIYPLKPSILSHSKYDDTVGEKKPYDKFCKCDCNDCTCKCSKKFYFSDSYIEMENGYLDYYFKVFKEGYYYLTFFADTTGKYENNLCKININDDKTDYLLDFHMTRNTMNSWKEIPLSTYDYTINTYDLNNRIYLKEGNNHIRIKSITKNNSKNYFNFFVISNKSYYDRRQNIFYYPNKNQVYLITENINNLNLNERTFKDGLKVITDLNTYELKVNRKSYEKIGDPLLYDLYLNDEIIIKKDLETYCTPILVTTIEPCNKTYYNKEFYIHFYMISFGKQVTTKNLIIDRKNINYKIIDLNLREKFIITSEKEYKKFFIKLDDLNLSEKIKLIIDLKLY